MILYYLPGLSRPIGGEDLNAYGLANHFRRITSRHTQTGPDGTGGNVLIDAAAGPADQCGFFVDRQEWRELPASNGTRAYWIGRDRSREIKPADLQRESLYPGHWVELADGQSWLVPVARLIPAVLVYDPASGWNAETNQKYAWIWQVASRFVEVFNEAAQAAENDLSTIFVDDWMIDAACDVLAINYRVGRVECSLLQLLTTETVQQILLALIDYPTEKKRAQQEAANAARLNEE